MTDSRRTAWLFAIAFLVLSAGYGLRDPWPADEPRFVLVAKQMFESGDWLFPHRGAELYPDKPPVYFWLLASARALLGSFRWSFLLPSLLAALGTMALVRDLAARLWTPRAGFWAATAVVVAIQFAYQAKRAQIDPTLVFMTTLGFYGIARHVLLGPHWRWYWAGCAAAGLGVITKGVGFLPLLALLPAALMARARWIGMTPPRDAPGERATWRWLAGIAAFFLPIALWLGPLLWVAATSGNPEHRAYLDNILLRQTAQRYADPWHHHEPWWYFLEVIALFWLPFALAIPWLLKPWRDAWRARDARVWLPLAWFMLVLAFFCASAGKRDMYLLPALPALALAAAPFLDAIATRAGFRRAVLVFVVALSALFLAAGLLAWFGEPGFERNMADERGIAASEARWLWAMLGAIGAIGLGAAAWGRVRGALPAAAALLAAVWLGYGFVVSPVLDDESSARGVMREARAIVGPEMEIGLVDWKEQNLLQAVGPVAEFGFLTPPEEQLQRALTWLAADPAGRILLVQQSEPLACIAFGDGRARRVGVANRRAWWLLRAPSAAPCGLPPARADAAAPDAR